MSLMFYLMLSLHEIIQCKSWIQKENIKKWWILKLWSNLIVLLVLKLHRLCEEQIMWINYLLQLSPLLLSPSFRVDEPGLTYHLENWWCNSHCQPFFGLTSLSLIAVSATCGLAKIKIMRHDVLEICLNRKMIIPQPKGGKGGNNHSIITALCIPNLFSHQIICLFVFLISYFGFKFNV